MMPSSTRYSRRCLTFLAVACGSVFQLGGCDFGQISTTVTVDGRELIIGAIRTSILDPLDNYITDRINDVFAEDGD